MKQILQSAKSGEVDLVEVPAPALAPGQVLVQNHFSVVSPGTEKLAMSFARKSLLGKARSRPDLVRQVVRKLRQEGPLPTYRAVMTRLEAPQPLGYSSAGVVLAVGEGVAGFALGDRVACAGAGYANHAEIVAVPQSLVARVPDGVPLEQAAWATLGAIALQGLRVAQPTLGEVAVVIGLGLIGQLAVQLLRANGCRVLGVDLDPTRVKQALDLGAAWGASPNELPGTWRDDATDGWGADLALVTASSESSAPIQLAAELCRLKGRISVVGAMPMELDRRTFYEKELELRMSTSYGPGRYDRTYEEIGLDYPLPYVRWTENRNLQAFLALVAAGSVQPQRLDAAIVPFAEAVRTYEDLARGERRSLAVVFHYDAVPSRTRSIELSGRHGTAAARSEIGVAVLGAGNYAKGVLLPALARETGIRRVSVVTATGASAKATAEKFGFASCGTDPETVFTDPNVQMVLIATRHDTHAQLAEKALRAGKAVWLEKPVGLSADEVHRVVAAARETGGFLFVGYNRRFSPHVARLRHAFASRTGPLAIDYLVAPGPAPTNSWIADPLSGGGRIRGEVCHFVDLCVHLVGELPSSVYARSVGGSSEVNDTTLTLIGFPGGSAAVIHYLGLASNNLPKERLEVSAGGLTGQLDNFRQTRFLGSMRRVHRDLRTLNQEKGHAEALEAVLQALRSGAPSPLPLAEIESAALATLAIEESLASGLPSSVDAAPAP